MKNFLVIDDDPVDTFVTERILEHVGFAYTLSKTTNGVEGLKLLEKLCADKQTCPDIIFLDLYMPYMNGFDFLDQYNRLDAPWKADTKVIVLTITHDTVGKDRALALGADAVFQKPLQLAELKKLLERNHGGTMLLGEA